MEKIQRKEHAAHFIRSIYALDRLYDAYAKSVGLTNMGLLVLHAIKQTDGVFTQKELCEVTGLPKQSIHLVIRSLLQNGYIEMREVARDRRNKEIRLSKSGNVYIEGIIDTLNASVAGALEDLSLTEQQHFLAAIDRIIEHIRQNIDHPCGSEV